MRQDYKS